MFGACRDLGHQHRRYIIRHQEFERAAGRGRIEDRRLSSVASVRSSNSRTG